MGESIAVDSRSPFPW